MGSCWFMMAVLLYWIVSLPPYYPPFPPPSLFTTTLQPFHCPQGGCLVFSNSIYPARVKISISISPISAPESQPGSYGCCMGENIAKTFKLALQIKHMHYNQGLDSKLLTQFTEFTWILFFEFVFDVFCLFGGGHHMRDWTPFFMNLIVNCLKAKLLM